VGQRAFDVILHGATGFVGQLTAAHLAAHAGTAKVGLSGRSEAKLHALRTELGVDWPVIVADAQDLQGLAELAESATVVASTVGPYAQHGLPLVTACAVAGTHYADLTGEALFVRQSASLLHDQARERGTRIVHSAGFDSVPSDLGVLLLHERVTADAEGTLEETVLVVKSLRGGVSGGTIDTVRKEFEAIEADPSLRAVLADPYALSPDPAAESALGRVHDSARPARDPLLGRWVAPFVMGPFNAQIVRRSNALQGFAYGPGFRYREVLGVGDSRLAPVLAAAAAAGLAGLMLGMSLRPTRAALSRVLPKPGEGPSKSLQRDGSFRMEVHTRTSTGARYASTVAAKGDPGYAATAVMLGQSALSLALDDLSSPGGVLTPAVAMGDSLIKRLQAQRFELSTRRLGQTS
jgi:short subunit dehydrogenase-like uncharacterized protein